MRTINLKVLRDIRSQKGQFITVTFLIFLGVALFTSFYMSYLNLYVTYETYYEDTSFEDLAISIHKAPADVLLDVRKIDGVKDVYGRITSYATYQKDTTRITLKLISIPDELRVNRPVIVEGRYPEKDERAIVLLKKFADYHGIKPGETVSIEVNGKKENLKVVGLAYSPEFIWIVDAGSWITTPKTFGIGFVPEGTLRKITDQTDIITEVHLTLFDSERSDEILNRLENIFSNYGITAMYKREDQPSNKLVRMDLDGFRELSFMFPSFFLFISALMVYVLLSRIVREQTGSIAILRALGYSRRDVMAHYISYSLVMGFIGASTGVIAGYLISIYMTAEYTQILNIPYYTTILHRDVAIQGALIGVLTPLVSGITTAYSASKIEPAIAMRGVEVSPSRIRTDRLIPFLKNASTLTRLSFRNLFRNPKRTLYSLVGIIASVVMILTSMAFLDSNDLSISLQFDKMNVYDMRVITSDEELYKEIKNYPGVRDVAPVIDTWVLIEKNGESKSLNLFAIGHDQNLLNIYDEKGKLHHPPPTGIILPEIYASKLRITQGEEINILTGFGNMKVKVAEIFNQPITPLSYADILFFSKKTGIKFNALLIRFDEEMKHEAENRILSIPGLRVESLEDLREYIDEIMSFFYIFIYFTLAFGASLGFASIFNTTTVNILERRREIATLRMLGYTTKEIAYTLLMETVFLSIIGILMGIPAGYLTAKMFFSSFQTDLYYMPFIIYNRTYILTAMATFIIVIISLTPGIRYVSRMEIEKVTKEIVS